MPSHVEPLISYLSKKKEWFAIPVCHGDKVLYKSFYHFFFGVLMPLLDLCRYCHFGANQRIYLLSCGMFNRILLELVKGELINLKIIPDIEVLKRLEALGADVEYFILDSMEAYFHRHGRFCVKPSIFSPDRFQGIAEYAKKHFLHEVDAPDCLIIRRKIGHDGHGADTRDIQNLDGIAQILSDDGYTVDVRTLEGESLANQISIFHSAKIVIAQHGASLANLVWMRPEQGSLVEIVPPEFRRDGWAYFEILAKIMQIPRIEIAQISRFAPVNESDILQAVRKLSNLLD